MPHGLAAGRGLQHLARMPRAESKGMSAPEMSGGAATNGCKPALMPRGLAAGRGLLFSQGKI